MPDTAGLIEPAVKSPEEDHKEEGDESKVEQDESKAEQEEANDSMSHDPYYPPVIYLPEVVVNSGNMQIANVMYVRMYECIDV